MTDEHEVLAANEAFYEAFAAGDAGALEALFARATELATAHPWRPATTGREGVVAGWRAILEAGAPPIRCVDPSVILLPGGQAALVSCVEDTGDAPCIATNVFVREEGEWRLCHHHGAPLAPVFGPGEGPQAGSVH